MPRVTVRFAPTTIVIALLAATRFMSLTAQSVTETGRTLPPIMPPREAVRPVKSEGTALLLSLAATALPIALATKDQSSAAPAIFGVLIGPALGHLYANNGRRAMKGIVFRSAIGGATIALAMADCANSSAWLCGIGEVLVGGAVMLISDIVDIVRAPASARQYNEERPTVLVVPMASGGLGIGIRVGF